MKLAVLSNVNVAPLSRALRQHTVAMAEYGNVVPALLGAAPGLVDDADSVIIVLDGDELANGPQDLGPDVIDAVESFASHHVGVLVAVVVVPPGPNALTFNAWLDRESPLRRHLRFMNDLADVSDRNSDIVALDGRWALEALGRPAAMSSTYWYAGRIPYSSAMFGALGAMLGELLAAHRHIGRKVLAVDLDNTLWGGVLGEVGIGGLKLSEDGIGKCFRDLQRQLLALQRAGVLLVAVSKNDEPAVLEVLDEHPMMLLRSNDFAAIRANWIDKATNLRELAATLDLGLDSFVFIDDNAVERELVRSEIPEIAVPEFPARAEDLPTWFVGEVARRHFPKLRVLDADRAKTVQYQARRKRQQLQTTVDLDQFIARLDIELTLHHDESRLADRISQLTQKTNQFNTTTRRYDVAEITRRIESPDWLVTAVDYRDRFGDEGTIGATLVDLRSGSIDVLLMSCRVIGRRVEQAMLCDVERVARAAHGLAHLSAEFIPTSRNSVAEGVYEAAGYIAVVESAAPIRRYVKELT